MFLTVAIPVYNAERYIRQSIESVLVQSFPDFELIVTDDGSSDRSLDIIRSFSDTRIIVISDGQHKGLAIRLNEQIAMARGKYFVRMDADDIMLPERLERQVKFVLSHTETDVLGASTIVIDENGNQIGWRGTGNWKRGEGRTVGGLHYKKVSSFMHPTIMGRTAWFRKYYYNPACEGCEDLDLWYRSRKESIFYSLYEPLLLYRDPQIINLSTYLFRRRQERYVLRINSGGLPFYEQYYRILMSWFKSFSTIFFSKIGRTDYILNIRNKNQSPLNNNVLHVITSLCTGGAEKLLVELLPLLKQKGKNVELVVFDGIRTPFYEALESKGVKIHSLRIGGSVYDIRNIWYMFPYLMRFDAVHTHNTAPQMFVAFAASLLPKKNRPILITTEHSTSNRRRGIPYFKCIDKWMYRQYDSIVTVSEIAGQNIKDYTGNMSLPIKTISNGIDVMKFTNAEPSLEIKGAFEGCYLGIMVAGFRYEKDHSTVIKAYKLLPENYHLLLVGDGEKRANCELLTETLGIKDRVHFLGVRMDVPNLLRSSNVVIMSSHREGLSLSNLEGMASGKPFIASDVDGLHEIVDGYGILVPHEDPKSLADSIQKVSEDLVWAKHVAARCVERALMFDISVMADKYNMLY